MKLQQRLRFLAYSDPLTNLYNRTYMMEQLEHALSRAKEQSANVALLFLDLDKFKIINDSLGHRAGDELLCEVAMRLSQAVINSDVIARWGGDEFLIMLTEEVTPVRIKELAQNILSSISQPVNLIDKTVNVGTSIGIALSDLHYDAELLIQQADMAMYAAKQSGRDNAKFFEPHMAKEVTSRFQHEQEIKKALELKQFYLVFQPQMDLHSNRVFGLEALIRWKHPEKGMISPAEFIPVAEESSLISKIGEMVLESAIAFIAKWQASMSLVPVAVNISGRHFMSDGFSNFIEQLLLRYGVSGQWLKVEITEGVFIHDFNQCIAVMTALKKLGVEISVDDFGTGYSSLHYLKKLPLDILKIDKSFVFEIGDNAEGDKICETIIQLAQNLELEVIAEGVETAAQAKVLADLGCHLHQGFHYFRPLAENDVIALLQQEQEQEQESEEPLNAAPDDVIPAAL